MDKTSGLGLIRDWASQIPKDAKPISKVTKTDSVCSVTTPCLIIRSTHSFDVPASTSSALTNNVIISHHNDGINLVNGGISNQDETFGEEHEVTIKSPPVKWQNTTRSWSGEPELTEGTWLQLMCCAPS